MDSYDSNQIVILQGFSRSTRFAILCTAQISKFQQKFVKRFSNVCWNFCKIASFQHFFIEFCTKKNFQKHRPLYRICCHFRFSILRDTQEERKREMRDERDERDDRDDRDDRDERHDRDDRDERDEREITEMREMRAINACLLSSVGLPSPWPRRGLLHASSTHCRPPVDLLLTSVHRVEVWKRVFCDVCWPPVDLLLTCCWPRRPQKSRGGQLDAEPFVHFESRPFRTSVDFCCPAFTPVLHFYWPPVTFVHLCGPLLTFDRRVNFLIRSLRP